MNCSCSEHQNQHMIQKRISQTQTWKILKKAFSEFFYKMTIMKLMSELISNTEIDQNQTCTQSESHDSKKDFFRTFLEICQISIKPFYMLARKQDHEIFAVIMKNIKKALKSKTYVDSQFFVSEKLHDIINIFEK